MKHLGQLAEELEKEGKLNSENWKIVEKRVNKICTLVIIFAIFGCLAIYRGRDVTTFWITVPGWLSGILMLAGAAYVYQSHYGLLRNRVLLHSFGERLEGKINKITYSLTSVLIPHRYIEFEAVKRDGKRIAGAELRPKKSLTEAGLKEGAPCVVLLDPDTGSTTLWIKEEEHFNIAGNVVGGAYAV